MVTTKEILREELERLRDDIIRRQKDAGAWASGKTAAGYEVAVESGTRGWLGGYSYAGVLEKGRKPGKVPVYFKEIIRRWIVAKGLQYKDDKDLNRMAASIAWVIRKKGTKLHRDGREVYIFDTPMKDFTDRLADRLASFYSIQTSNEVYKQWQP
ncbi:MAG: hypothetical protein LBJ01_03260 [Tannerella sp.]|jgi:hypothetical protein|nr:hypothetical protein [Tannerella sp.]